MKSYFFKSFTSFLFAFIALLSFAQSPSPYPLFDQWAVEKLPGGILHCGSWNTSLEDNFNGTTLDTNNWNPYLNKNPYGGRLHAGADAVIFTDENISISGGYLTMTTKAESLPIVLDSFGLPFDVGPYEDILYLKRNASGAVIQAKGVYNMGRYEMRFQSPKKLGVWNAFWMWHGGDEIDIIDLGFMGKFAQNVTRAGNTSIPISNEGYTASLLTSPCCPEMRECDFARQLR